MVTQAISLDGCEFQATENLVAALRVLRTPEQRIFWIDALCIDQLKNEEMAESYVRCQEVYI